MKCENQPVLACPIGNIGASARPISHWRTAMAIKMARDGGTFFRRRRQF